MSRLYINDYVNNLQQQISSSVAKIRQKSSYNQPAESLVSSDYRARVEVYAYQLLPGQISWTLQESTTVDVGTDSYAAASYRQAGEVLKEPTVLLDFMFKNNREFDFKV